MIITDDRIPAVMGHPSTVI